MGIHGLTSFIDNNPDMLKDHKLHDCRIVIDGNNFYHFLYFYCNVRFQFGGDYDIYQRKIAKIFNMFKSCGIQAYVVFDGAYTVDGKKFQTTIGRARGRVFAAKRIMYGHRGTLIPCLAQLTFRQTLDALGIPHVTCDFEADNQLVTLANLWRCPVVSNDSDFYIFDLVGGFIPLDYIDFRPRQLSEEGSDSGGFLQVQFYHVESFINCFNSLSRSVLPLFATMLGNDYVNASAFEEFYQKKVPKMASRRYRSSKKHQKIVSILYWLEEKEHKGELVSEVLTFIRPEKQQEVKKLLTDSINGYLDTMDFDSFSLKEYLEGHGAAVGKKTEFVVDGCGQTLPGWFVTACRRGEIPASTLNVALLGRIILHTQVEEVSLPVSTDTSKPLREVFYSVLFSRRQTQAALETTRTGEPVIHGDQSSSLTSSQLTPTGQASEVHNSDACDRSPTSACKVIPYKEASDFDSAGSRDLASDRGVVEYTRHNTELWRVIVEPRTSLAKYGQIPSLEKINALCEGEKQAILLESFGVTKDFVDMFDAELQLYAACVVFWARNTVPPVTLLHLKGILLCCVLLHVHKELAGRDNKKTESCFRDGKIEKELSGKVCSDKATETSSSASEGGEIDICGDHNGRKLFSHTQQNSNSLQLSIRDICSSADLQLLEKVRDNFKKYYNDPVQIGRKNPPDPQSFHSTAQFQACLVDAVQLNCVLRCPFPTPNPAWLLNGSFIYTIVAELQSRSHPDLFLAEMLIKESAVALLFDSLCAEIVSRTGESVFAESRSQGGKSRKGGKKKKKSQGKECRSKMVEEMEGDGEECIEAVCDLNNRFGVLAMDV